MGKHVLRKKTLDLKSRVFLSPLQCAFLHMRLFTVPQSILDIFFESSLYFLHMLISTWTGSKIVTSSPKPINSWLKIVFLLDESVQLKKTLRGRFFQLNIVKAMFIKKFFAFFCNDCFKWNRTCRRLLMAIRFFQFFVVKSSVWFNC